MIIHLMMIFHENSKFSKTHSEYQEQPYPLEKTTIAFLDPPKRMHVTFEGYSWSIQGMFLYSIFWEYIMGMFHEYFTNIYLPGGNILIFFLHKNCTKIAVFH